MAESYVHPLAIPLVVGFFLLIVGILALSYWQKRKRREIIRKLKKEKPTTFKDGDPILLDGIASAPELHLPSSGEKVAFYTIDIVSKRMKAKSSIFGSEIKGFAFADISSNFTVTDSHEKSYEIDMQKFLESSRTGVGTLRPIMNYAFTSKFANLPYKEKFIDMFLEKKAIETLNIFVFSTQFYESSKGKETSIPFHNTTDSFISINNIKSNVNCQINEYEIGGDTPKAVMEFLEENNILGTLAEAGDEIYVIENYIPINEQVYVVGTYTEQGESIRIESRDSNLGLIVSYKMPKDS
jgi:hypothetical protein